MRRAEATAERIVFVVGDDEVHRFARCLGAEPECAADIRELA